jgi:hypothetical protein
VIDDAMMDQDLRAGGRRGASIWCAILGLCAVAASSAAQSPDEGAKRIILASWESGPLTDDVAVYDDGAVIIHDEETKEHWARLGRTDLVRLQADLASSAFASALGRLVDDTVLHHTDGEIVSFYVGDRPEAGSEMCSDEPMDAAVVKLGRDLNAATLSRARPASGPTSCGRS